MDSREQFEAAMTAVLVAEGYKQESTTSILAHNGREYQTIRIEGAWLGWQASREALEDKARSQHARDSAELRDLCSQRDGFKAELWRVKEERDSQQRIAIAAMTELAELKAKMSGVDDRAEFEAAYLKANYPRVHSGELSAPPIFVKTKAGEYDDPDMQRTWIMWQARATLSAPSHGEQVREWAEGLPPHGSECEARIPHHTKSGVQMLWCPVEVLAHAIVQDVIYSWVKEPGKDGGFYAPMMLSFRTSAPSAGSQQGGDV